jgi:diketogulonate reductase-like aldo/keto reductase
VPYFPLGGFSPLQSRVLDAVADRLGVSALSVALAWLRQRSPNTLLVPGTSSLAHLRENVAAAGLTLPAGALDELDAVGAAASPVAAGSSAHGRGGGQLVCSRTSSVSLSASPRKLKATTVSTIATPAG